jgi:hypothetical protein
MSVEAPATQLRCRSKLHGIMKPQPDGSELLEIRCKDKWCAERGAGLVVLHYFNVDTGELIKTKKYRDPNYRRKGN